MDGFGFAQTDPFEDFELILAQSSASEARTKRGAFERQNQRQQHQEPKAARPQTAIGKRRTGSRQPTEEPSSQDYNKKEQQQQQPLLSGGATSKHLVAAKTDGPARLDSSRVTAVASGDGGSLEAAAEVAPPATTERYLETLSEVSEELSVEWRDQWSQPVDEEDDDEQDQEGDNEQAASIGGATFESDSEPEAASLPAAGVAGERRLARSTNHLQQVRLASELGSPVDSATENSDHGVGLHDEHHHQMRTGERLPGGSTSSEEEPTPELHLSAMSQTNADEPGELVVAGSGSLMSASRQSVAVEVSTGRMSDKEDEPEPTTTTSDLKCKQTTALPREQQPAALDDDWPQRKPAVPEGQAGTEFAQLLRRELELWAHNLIRILDEQFGMLMNSISAGSVVANNDDANKHTTRQRSSKAKNTSRRRRRRRQDCDLKATINSHPQQDQYRDVANVNRSLSPPPSPSMSTLTSPSTKDFEAEAAERDKLQRAIYDSILRLSDELRSRSSTAAGCAAVRPDGVQVVEPEVATSKRRIERDQKLAHKDQDRRQQQEKDVEDSGFRELVDYYERRLARLNGSILINSIRPSLWEVAQNNHQHAKRDLSSNDHFAVEAESAKTGLAASSVRYHHEHDGHLGAKRLRHRTGVLLGATRLASGQLERRLALLRHRQVAGAA